MADAILLFSEGESFYPEDYTATPGKVRTGKRFRGNGSYDTQTGTLEEVAAVEHSLPINGSYSIPAGIHSGQDKITQNIPTQGNTEITPSAAGETVAVSGKYMLTNVTINPVSNFRPDVIKRGVKVGIGDQEITGTFEGFVT